MKIENWSGRTTVSFAYRGSTILASVEQDDGYSGLQVVVKMPDKTLTSTSSVEEALAKVEYFWYLVDSDMAPSPEGLCN